MMQTLTRLQVREVDRLAIEELGIPGIVLMENAARNAAAAILDVIEGQLQLTPVDARVVVLCGGGNNGGDGYAIARHLHNVGATVILIAAKAPAELSGDAATNHAICAAMGLDIRPVECAAEALRGGHVAVDALLGTGFAGEVRPPLASLIALTNESRATQGLVTVAIDVPSGLDCDTGQPAAPTIEADLTVTFVAAKPGLLAESARPYVGELVVADIGSPPELIAQATR